MASASRFAPYVGRASAPLTLDIERGHIRRFAEAIGDPNPIYYDEAAARDAGYPRIPAPPTFAIALRPNDPRAGIDIDWTKLLHGEQELILHRPILAGDRVTLVGRIADAQVKQGKSGEMDVLVLETLATDGYDRPLFLARAHVLVRR
jgi:acyl dehydratase